MIIKESNKSWFYLKCNEFDKINGDLIKSSIFLSFLRPLVCGLRINFMDALTPNSASELSMSERTHNCKLIYVEKQFHFDNRFTRFHLCCALRFAIYVFNAHNYARCTHAEWHSTIANVHQPMDAAEKCTNVKHFCISYCHTCVICMRAQSQQVCMLTDRKNEQA